MTLAACSKDGQKLSVLISNYNSAVGSYTVRLVNHPWKIGLGSGGELRVWGLAPRSRGTWTSGMGCEALVCLGLGSGVGLCGSAALRELVLVDAEEMESL